MARPVIRRSAILLAWLAGCAAMEPEFARTRDGWNGAAFEEVVARWGPPARSETLPDGAQKHTWVSEAYHRTGGMTVGIFGGSFGSRGGVGVGANAPFGSRDEAVRCERTLIFRGGAVVEQNWAGQPEFCNSFRRS